MFQKHINLNRGFVVCAILMTILFGLSRPAEATNGYFSHGYGVIYQALAGAGVALPLQTLGAATNPAALVFLGNRYDIEVGLFNPSREYTVAGGPSGFPGTFGLMPGTVESDSKLFVMPAMGANWMLGENASLGIILYGNGGMNTNYPTNTFYGSSPTGVNLAQIFVAANLAVKLSSNHGIGVAPIFCYQYFSAKGLEAFGMFSVDPTNLTNNDTSSSTGFGIRFGYLGKWAPFLSVGAAYQTKIKTSSFDEYAGLYENGGDFDIPASWTVGIALHPSDSIDLAFDVQQVLYSGIKAIGNPFVPAELFQGKLLGTPDGPGFGWTDMTTYKGGIQMRSNGGWTWRAGYSYGSQPIPESEMLFNILAPGVVEQHVTFGFTKNFSGKTEMSIAVMHAFSNSISGPNPMEVPGLQTIDLKMSQWQFVLGFSF